MPLARRRAIVALASSPVVAALALACGSNGGDVSSPPPDAGVDRLMADPDVIVTDTTPPLVDAADDLPPVPDGGCNVRIEAPPVVAGTHVAEGTPITYASNPPSSGPHYPIWANFQEYAQSVEDGYLVHSLEHGAVLLAYTCDPAACPGVLAGLRAVRDAIATDPLCDPTIRVRVILAPRPANDVSVAAAAWGHTYRADCVDVASLIQFVNAHYAQAPENFCSPGKTTF